MIDEDREIDGMDPDKVFSRAISLGEEEEFDKAIMCLQSLLSRGIRSVAIHLKAGEYFQKKGCLDEAAEQFMDAICLSPAHEFASLCLFHLLLDRGERDEAFEEMKRFVLMGGKSRDYEEIVREINEKEKRRQETQGRDTDSGAEPEKPCSPG